MTEKMKGIVMEYEEGMVTVLTPNGEFLQTPWTNEELPLLGGEIEFVRPIPKNVPRFPSYLVYLAASLVLLLVTTPIWGGVFLFGSARAVAYVSIDINPSLELGINEKGRVVEINPLNEDASKVVQEMDLLKKPVGQAVKLVTDKAFDQKYLAPSKDNYILITVSEPSEVVKSAELVNEAQVTLNKHQLAGKVEAIEVPLDIHDQAKKAGVSAGKYLIWLEAQESGLGLSLDELKGSSITKAVKNAGGNPGALVSQAQHDKKILKDIIKKHNPSELPKQGNVKINSSGKDQVLETGDKEQGNKNKGRSPNKQDSKNEKSKKGQTAESERSSPTPASDQEADEDVADKTDIQETANHKSDNQVKESDGSASGTDTDNNTGSKQNNNEKAPSNGGAKGSDNGKSQSKGSGGKS